MQSLANRIIPEGLTFDDVLLIPARSEVLPREVDITTHFSRDLKISVLTTTRAYNELEEEGFITSRQGKGFFVMSSGSNLIREQLIQEVEKNLNSAILAAERASMTDEELIKLLRLLLEVNHE